MMIVRVAEMVKMVTGGIEVGDAAKATILS